MLYFIYVAFYFPVFTMNMATVLNVCSEIVIHKGHEIPSGHFTIL